MFVWVWVVFIASWGNDLKDGQQRGCLSVSVKVWLIECVGRFGLWYG